MSSALCITVYIHYLHVTAAQFYSLPPLTSQWDTGTGTINFCISEGIFQPLEVGMSLQTQSLRLAGERAGRWNEVREWGICAVIISYRLVSKLIVGLKECVALLIKCCTIMKLVYCCPCVGYSTGTFLHSTEVVVMPWQPIYRVLPNLTIVCSWDTSWVSPPTSMQVAMVMTSQFIMMYVCMVTLPVLHDTSSWPS